MSDYLTKAQEIVSGDRVQDYGDTRRSFERIAKIWSAVLGISVSTEQVSLCMIGVKMGRLCNTPMHADSWVDIAGYVECQGMIHKRNKEEEDSRSNDFKEFFADPNGIHVTISVKAEHTEVQPISPEIKADQEMRDEEQ